MVVKPLSQFSYVILVILIHRATETILGTNNSMRQNKGCTGLHHHLRRPERKQRKVKLPGLRRRSYEKIRSNEVKRHEYKTDEEECFHAPLQMHQNEKRENGTYDDSV